MNVFLNIFTARIFYIHTTMNRDIITADIEWGLDGEYNASPILNLKVEIDDADFNALNGVYIEDIKLYNQNTFVNPTNVNGGISIFDDAIFDNPRKTFWYHKIPNQIDKIFKKDDTPSIDDGHYMKENGDYIQATGTPEETFTFITNNPYFYNVSSDTFATVDYTNRDAENFYLQKPKAYEYKNLQMDSRFEQNFDISNDIIIISVKIHPNPDDKCESDYILKAVYNKRLLLLESMAGVREINDTCTIPRRFIDFILRQKAIDLAQANNDIDLLCKYFRLFSGSIGTNNIEFAPCGCLRG